MTITYLKGDAIRPDSTPGLKIIAHIVNDYGGWGKGFVLAISKRWTEPEFKYRAWGEGRLLGRVQTIQVEPDIYVANMCAQHGNHVDYTALAWCLNKLNPQAVAHSATIHMPRIGCGLGGGKWEHVEPLILKHLQSPVFVYDL